MSDYYRCPCGNPLEKVTQSANSMLNSEQFDAGRMGDWFCCSCPTNEGKNRYFWDSEVAALAVAPASSKEYAELRIVRVTNNLGVADWVTVEDAKAFADATHALRTGDGK